MGTYIIYIYVICLHIRVYMYIYIYAHICRHTRTLTQIMADFKTQQ